MAKQLPRILVLVAFWLVIIGALNWSFKALSYDKDLVEMAGDALGETYGEPLSRVVYGLVAASALVVLADKYM